MSTAIAEVPAGPPFRYWNTLRLMRDPYGFYGGCRARYGDTFRVKAANGDVICTCDPAQVRDLLKADHEQIKPFAADALGPLVGENSLLLLHGVKHRAERKRLSPPFHGARMRAYGDAILAATASRTELWTDGGEIVAADETLAVSISVIVQAVFGVLDPSRIAAWTQATRLLVDGTSPAVLFAPRLRNLPGMRGVFQRFEASKATFDGLVRAEVANRRETGERGEDILSMMLDATDADGVALTDDEIRDEMLTLMFAGHETTQIAMAWMLYHLAREPAARAALLAELDACDGSPEVLGRLPYLEAVWNETLRLANILPDILRTLTADLPFGDRVLPAGTHVAVIAALVHTREDLYPEPLRFRPERFLERSFKPHEFLPFGGGVRRCIGAALATWEAKVAVGTILREWSVQSLGEEWPVRRNATLGPAHGVRLRVRRRAGAAVRTGSSTTPAPRPTPPEDRVGAP